MNDYTFDLQRIFVGDQPPIFLLEIAFRTSFLLIYTFCLLRFVGARGVRQLSIAEFVLIIALGSAVGDPMFYDDVPLLHGMAVVTVVVLFERFITWLTMRDPRTTAALEGKVQRVVADGVLDMQGVVAARLAYHEIYGALRQHRIENLGQVRRAYFETDGVLSVFRFTPETARVGLSLVEAAEKRDADGYMGSQPVPAGDYASLQCGFVRHSDGEPLGECPQCGGAHWFEATRLPEDAEFATDHGQAERVRKGI